jgi:putative ABC transport system permease protein
VSTFEMLGSRDFDLGAAFRGLLRHRGFAVTAALTLALGVGANTAIISAVRGIAFKPLPYPDGDRLVHIWAFWPGGAGNMSFPDGVAIAERSRVIEASATYQSYGTAALTGRNPPEELHTSFVTPSYFDLLGGRAALGRVFRAAEDAEGYDPAVVVLSHGAWMRTFGGDPAVIGRRIGLNGLSFEVVGVLPENFADLGAVEGPAPDVFLPTAAAAKVMGQPPRTDALRLYWGLARLKAGATIEMAKQELTLIAGQLEKERPSTHRGYGLQVQSLSERIRGGFVLPSFILMAGSFFVLLIGAANVTNLLLLRFAERKREMALRSALGASSVRLVRMVFVEAAVLASVGVTLGALLGAVLSRAAAAWVRANVSTLLDVSLDPVALGASSAFAAAAVLLIGLVPAFHARRSDIVASLNAAGRSGMEGGSSFTRKALMASEVGFALVLLFGAGLMVRSFDALTNTPLGFRTENLLTFRMDLAGPKYQDPASRAAAAERFVESVRATPGVESATVWGPSMLGKATWVMNVAPEGKPTDRPDAFTMLFRHSVSPGGLSSLGIERLAGRDFESTDTPSAPLVAIVSESAARQLWPGQDAVGKALVRSTPNLPLVTVIGVVKDARHRERYSLQDVADAGLIGGIGPQRDIYFPYAQRPNNGVTFAARLRNPSQDLRRSLQRAAAAIDPDLPISDVRFLDERIAEQERVPRAIAGLLSAAALLAALLAATGIYAVVAQAVGQRSREIGLRAALGAGRADILGLVVRQGLFPVSLGAAVGVAVSLFFGRWVGAMLFGISSADPSTFVAVALSLLLVAGAAIIFPARRALAVDPSVALRAE